MAWRRPDDKPLPEQMMTQFTGVYIYVYIRHLADKNALENIIDEKHPFLFRIHFANFRSTE